MIIFFFFLLLFLNSHSWNYKLLTPENSRNSLNANYGEVRVSNENNYPGARNGHIMFTNEDRDKAYIFGGKGYIENDEVYQYYMNDLWEYEVESNSWTWINGRGNLYMADTFSTKFTAGEVSEDSGDLLKSPQGRAYFAFFYGLDMNTIFIFGGLYQNFLIYYNTNSMWYYKIDENEWFKNDDPSDLTTGQFDISAVKMSTEEAFVFTGSFIEIPNTQCSRDFKNDLISFNIETNSWRRVKYSGYVDNFGTYPLNVGVYGDTLFPPARAGYIAFEYDGLYCLIGGFLTTGYTGSNSYLFSDVWCFNVSTNNWGWVGGVKSSNQEGALEEKYVFREANRFSSRYHFFGVQKPGEIGIHIIGGEMFYNSLETMSSEIWQYNPQINQFRYMNGSFSPILVDNTSTLYSYNEPVSRWGANGVSVPKIIDNETKEVLLIFGGLNKDYLNDFWIYYKETGECFGISWEDEKVCNGNGNCNPKTGECSCFSFYGGDVCEEFGSNWEMIILIGIPSAGAIVCLLFFFTSICCLILSNLITKVSNQKEKLGKFDGIKDEDIQYIKTEREFSDSKGFDVNLKINKHLFAINIDEIKVNRKIGEGGSNAGIFLATWRSKTVAFKCFKINDFLDQERYNEFETEASILASVSHPYILTCYGCTLKIPRIGIIMEFCENGNLKEYCEKNKIDFYSKLKILGEVADAMDYLHARNIIHRDIKPENVLIDSRGVSKLMDFGLAKVVKINNNVVQTSRVGTSIYMAPEVSLGEDYTEKCDVFSFGMMTYCVILDNYYPYGRKSTFNIELKVASSNDFRPNIELDSFNNEKWLTALIKRCWSSLQDERPSFEEIFKLLTSKGKNEQTLQMQNNKRELRVEKRMKKIKKIEVDKSIDDFKKILRQKEKRILVLEDRISRLLENERKLRKEHP